MSLMTAISTAAGTTNHGAALLPAESDARAATDFCRALAADSVYDASNDGGVLASALEDQAIDVTRYPSPRPGRFGLATALGLPAGSASARDTLIRELSDRSDTVLLSWDWSEVGRPTAGVAYSWLIALAQAGLHVDFIASGDGTLRNLLLFRRSAEPLTSRLLQTMAHVIVNTHRARAAQEELSSLRSTRATDLTQIERLDTENRLLRQRIDAHSREIAALRGALADVNDLLSHELEAVHSAEAVVAEDIDALTASPLWRLKLRLAGVKRGRE
ncbi:hypothetical protein WPS_29390 [Vulcanimicrobium alpinum]|uniref:Uncharacterized protein n=1 Tax=Vulcanimicrobium alpinum TaxID=3016050 RepID=A0AAN2CB72_UNVUL|nr:hypothetical protein [Vulcanimicrobium alpinum]BDE07663.1 hypothetical protein WPS_29390 [Vulcanimicrobium alpinum]